MSQRSAHRDSRPAGLGRPCPTVPLVVLIAAVLVATGNVRAESPIAIPVEGQPFAAELVGTDAQWNLVWRTAAGSRTMNAAELVRWGTPVEPPRGPIVVLADGGRLPAIVLGVDRGSLAADSFRFLPDATGAAGLKLPLELLAGVIFHLPADRQQRDLLADRLTHDAGKSDRLILTNGDEMAATIQTVGEDSVRLISEVGPVDVPRSRVRAILFNPALRRPSRPEGLSAWTSFRDGAELLVSGLHIKGDSLRITLPGGVKLKADPRDLVFLQPQGGRVTYLSDRKADAYRFVPFFNLPWPYHNNRSVTGSRLRAEGRLHLKGIGVHSASRLMYRLDGSYARMDASLAVDDSTGARGSVRFRVFVDGRQQAAVGPVRGGDRPVPLSVDLTGAKQLDLVVDYAERGDELDHADWLEARLVK